MHIPFFPSSPADAHTMHLSLSQKLSSHAFYLFKISVVSTNFDFIIPCFSNILNFLFHCLANSLFSVCSVNTTLTILGFQSTSTIYTLGFFLFLFLHFFHFPSVDFIFNLSIFNFVINIYFLSVPMTRLKWFFPLPFFYIFFSTPPFSLLPLGHFLQWSYWVHIIVWIVEFVYKVVGNISFFYLY